LDELEEEEKGVQFPELKRFSTAKRFPLERFRVSKGRMNTNAASRAVQKASYFL
jgi:hypothetical protein